MFFSDSCFGMNYLSKNKKIKNKNSKDAEARNFVAKKKKIKEISDITRQCASL